MQILPVLDLLNGVVVRGIAGQRSEYRPLISRLTQSVQALDVARAIRDSFELHRFYVADLDAILHRQPNWELYRQLIGDGFELLIDAGISSVEQSTQVRQAGGTPIVGLESCPDPQILADIVAANEGDITFSLDLQNGRPLLPVDFNRWSADPLGIVGEAVQAGIRRLIVLDLADVGTSSGGRTHELCCQILARFPSLQLIGGGGVRSMADVYRLKQAGVSSVLVASALHDGRLTAADLQTLRTF